MYPIRRWPRLSKAALFAAALGTAVVGLSNQGAGCPQGSVRRVTEPMMHVWLTPVAGGPLAPDPSTLSQMVAAYRVPAPTHHNGTA